MEWKTVKIGELGKIVTGKTPRTAIKDNYGGQIPFLTPSDDMTHKTMPKTAKTLTEKGLMEVRNNLLPPNTICISCIGSDLGKVVKTSCKIVTNQQINSIIPYDHIDADFIYYLMIPVGKELNFISKTSTAVPLINKSTFSDFKVTIPSNLADQRKIASILSSLDAQIENNNRINRNLEEQAQALFKSWFVDFEPWGGTMPADWKEGVLGDYCESVLGGTPSRDKAEYWNGSIAWINSGEVNRFRITSPSEWITELGVQKSATKLLPAKTTVLAITGATLGQVSLLEIDTCANQSVIGILQNDRVPYEYIYPLINFKIALY